MTVEQQVLVVVGANTLALTAGGIIGLVGMISPVGAAMVVVGGGMAIWTAMTKRQ